MKVEMSYKERVDWIFDNYYESGMERGIMYENLKDVNLDEFEMYGEVVSVPKYKDVITAEEIFEKHIGLNAEMGYVPIKKEDVIAAIEEALKINNK
jgi:hypothetical protein